MPYCIIQSPLPNNRWVRKSITPLLLIIRTEMRCGGGPGVSEMADGKSIHPESTHVTELTHPRNTIPDISIGKATHGFLGGGRALVCRQAYQPVILLRYGGGHGNHRGIPRRSNAPDARELKGRPNGKQKPISQSEGVLPARLLALVRAIMCRDWNSPTAANRGAKPCYPITIRQPRRGQD